MSNPEDKKISEARATIRTALDEKVAKLGTALNEAQENLTRIEAAYNKAQRAQLSYSKVEETCDEIIGMEVK